MAQLVRWVADQYDEVLAKRVDPRSQDWLLARSILVPLTIIALYLLTVTRWGPRFMRDREPLKIRHLIVAYNISNIAACCYVVYHGCAQWHKMKYSFLCQPVDMRDTEDNRRNNSLVFFLDGGFILLGIINCFVHIVMYSYYLYTVLFPRQRPGLGVKKSLTLLQLIQFAILLVHTILPCVQRSCEVQNFLSFVLSVQYTFMIVMFSDFYMKTYSSSQKSK
ncbi:Elongation of very long chain fatty acids protein AAEL008004 [Frankliniella fusca]|uniref:Elongation of very long chain fatty acids protein n=1 Tax=Frankliniella fusca TaxID=407009 RepID=A0AAE1LC60_9NEOP|nr:Elongation of very long chain fatty acids protein AAEL008004 [Frankliniella fusca]